MKKKILFLFLLFVLILSFFPVYHKNRKILSDFPAFYHQTARHLKKNITYTGSDFSVTRETEEPKGFYAKAYCLYDAETGQILFGKNEKERLPMASTTKIMTCILALERGNPKDKVTFSRYAASMPDVQLNAREGDTFYLNDLLYSLMLESHNDTAVAIAEHIAGSVEGFAALMNEKARLLGCKDTNFVTPNGLDDKKHYTTAADLCSIASYAVKNKKFLKIIKTPSHSFKDCTKKKSYEARSHNLFLSSYTGAIGIKTGFTGKAGYCFCGAAKRNGTTLISSVLASGFPPHKTYKWTDTKKLMDYGFANFKTITLNPIPAPKILSVYQAAKSDLAITCKLPKKITFTLSGNSTVTHVTELPSHLTAPIRKGDIVGYEKYYQNNILLYQFPVLAGETVPVRDYSYFNNLIKQLFFFSVP